MALTIRWSLFGVVLSLVLFSSVTRADAQTVYACVNNSSGTAKIVSPTTTCHKNETLMSWGGGPVATSYGVGAVSVKRGTGVATIWAAYSTPLGSPVATDPFSIAGDTASGTFRFTCSTAHAVCELSVSAATLSNTAGETVYVYPRVLMQKQAYLSALPQYYCEYGDGSAGTAPALIPTQATTPTPTYTPMLINIGGSADCGGPLLPAGDVAVITVGPGHYDVFTTFLFKRP